jgi:hypothetical protein
VAGGVAGHLPFRVAGWRYSAPLTRVRERQSSFGTAQGELQAALGDLGEVLPYVAQSHRDNGFPAVGWYAQLEHQIDGCNCPACQATRVGRPAFLSGRRIEAIEEIGVYKHLHPALLQR